MRCVFQSTPTGFPAGDAADAVRPAMGCCFNPRRPVSRPATGRSWCAGTARPRFNPRRPVSRPATKCGNTARVTVDVSIHADRFPGRRPAPAEAAPQTRPFQSTPTGFPAGDPVRAGAGDCFNPRRPVSRPATAARRAAGQPVAVFQSTPTGFPAGDTTRAPPVEGPGRFNPRRPVSRPATQCGVWR